MKKQSLLGIAIIFSTISSCGFSEKKNNDDMDYYYEKAKTTEVWIWDRVEYRTEMETLVYTSEDFNKNSFWFNPIPVTNVVPYTFIFYENGYYDTCVDLGDWNDYLKEFKDGDGPSGHAQFWKIENSYFYTTYVSFKAKRDAELHENFRILSNDSNTIVLRPIDDFYATYATPGIPGYWDYWTVTLTKKKYRDFQ